MTLDTMLQPRLVGDQAGGCFPFVHTVTVAAWRMSCRMSCEGLRLMLNLSRSKTGLLQRLQLHLSGGELSLRS
jgi:hypothetical protein